MMNVDVFCVFLYAVLRIVYGRHMNMKKSYGRSFNSRKHSTRRTRGFRAKLRHERLLKLRRIKTGDISAFDSEEFQPPKPKRPRLKDKENKDND